MRRALSIALLAAAALPATASGASPPASVRLADCSVEKREAAFYARMRLVDGAYRMAMRFTLLEETGAERAKAVKAPSLRRWQRSKPGVAAFGYRQGFRNLPENAAHRVRVDFRWFSPSGVEVLRARRQSTLCGRFLEPPNLVAQFTRMVPTALPAVTRYQAIVSNTGEGRATGIPVRLTIDGDVVDTMTVASLEPGERRAIAIRGPECHSSATLEVDPDRAIAESSDDDNVYELSCAALRNAG